MDEWNWNRITREQKGSPERGNIKKQYIKEQPGRQNNQTNIHFCLEGRVKLDDVYSFLSYTAGSFPYLLKQYEKFIKA